MSAKVDLHSVTTSAWNARLSPNEWASDVIEWNKTANQSCRVLSASICDLLLTQISIGPSPSPLLVSYLQYGMITRLVHPLDFFTRLPSVVSPSRPVQLNSFLTLLIAPFIQHIRAFDEETGDELCEATWRDEISHMYAEIAQELARAYISMCTVLSEGVEYGIKEPTKPPSKSDASNPTSPLSALFSPPTSPPAVGTPPPSQQSKVEAKGMVTTNVHLCADILTEVLTTPRTKGFVLMSRYLYPEQWTSVVATLKKCCVPSLERLSLAYQSLIKSNSASLPWLSRSDPEGLGLPWMSLMLAVDFETKGKIMYSLEDAFVRFEMMRSIRGYSHVDFYCELWCASLRSLQRIDYLTMEWIQCKDFLLVKVPLLMCKWKQVLAQESNPVTSPTASHPSSGPSSPPPSSASASLSSASLTPIPSSPGSPVFNDVEMSIFYASQFSQLVEKQTKDGLTFDPLDWIARSCIIRGLASVENIKALIPTITITLPPPSAHTISIPALVSGEIPNTEEDVNALKRLISPELRLEESTAQVMSAICTSLCKNTDIQEHIVMLVLYVLDKDSNLDLPLVLNLIAQLSREDVLTVLKAHGRMPQMMAYLVQYCDEWGYGPPEDVTLHYRFGTAFCLLVKALEYHNLRSHNYNQIVLHFVLRSIAARKIGVFITPTQSNALHPRFHSHPETPFPFWSWYRNYLHIYSTHTPYSTTHAPQPSGACSYRNDPVQVVAHKLLEVLRLSLTLPPGNVKEKLQNFLGTTPPWTLIQCIPYLCSTLYQACLVGLPLESLVKFLTPLAKEVPHCISEIAFWFIDEFARGMKASDMRPEGPLPLSILQAIVQIEVPAIVVDAMKSLLGPILNSLRQRYATVIDAVLVKLAWIQPRYSAFIDVESVNASKFLNEVFERVLDVAYPSSDLIQASFNSMFLLCAKIGPTHFVDLVCKEFMNVMINQTGKGHSTVHAMRTAELCGAIIGACGSATGLRLLYTEKVPIFLHWIKNAFQSELLAYYCMIAGLFCGVFHVSAFVTSIEDSFGLQTSFAMQHISQIVSDLIDMQLRQVTPVFTFATTFLSLLLTLPRTRLNGLSKALVHQIGTKLKQLGRSDLVVSLLDFSDSSDRAFAAHLFTSPI